MIEPDVKPFDKTYTDAYGKVEYDETIEVSCTEDSSEEQEKSNSSQNFKAGLKSELPMTEVSSDNGIFETKRMLNDKQRVVFNIFHR